MVTQDGPNYRIGVQDLASGTVRILSHGRLDASPSFAPNGAMIIYSGIEGGHSILQRVSVDGLTSQRLRADSADVREPVWAPFRVPELYKLRILMERHDAKDIECDVAGERDGPRGLRPQTAEGHRPAASSQVPAAGAQTTAPAPMALGPRERTPRAVARMSPAPGGHPGAAERSTSPSTAAKSPAKVWHWYQRMRTTWWHTRTCTCGWRAIRMSAAPVSTTSA